MVESSGAEKVSNPLQSAGDVVCWRPLPFALPLAAKLGTKWRRGAVLGPVLSAWENFVFEVRTPREVGVLRITECVRRTRDQISAEQSLLLFLNERAQPVPKPSTFADGQLLLSCGGDFVDYSACVFEWRTGRQVEATEVLSVPRFIERWGELVGGLHRVLSRYTASEPRRFTWLENPLLAGDDDPSIQGNVYVDTLACIANEVASNTPGPQDFGLVHADLHGRNVLVDEDSQLSIIDFDDCCYHWFCYDLAVCLDWLFRAGGRYHQVRTALLAGYSRTFSLSATAESLLDRLAFVRNALDYKLTLERLRAQPDASTLARRASTLECTMQWQIRHVL